MEAWGERGVRSQNVEIDMECCLDLINYFDLLLILVNVIAYKPVCKSALPSSEFHC